VWVRTLARRPWRRRAEEVDLVEAEIEDEIAAEVAAEVGAEVDAEAGVEVAAETLTLTRPRPQDRYTSEVGAEIEVVCSAAVA
jgi:hypothetical protein